MKYLIDAQLPRRLASWFASAGLDAIHTLDMPNQNRSTDDEIISLAAKEQRIVMSKDSDFVDEHLLRGQPQKLLLISTGNMSNDELCKLILPLIPDIDREFQNASFIELGRSGIVVRS